LTSQPKESRTREQITNAPDPWTKCFLSRVEHGWPRVIYNQQPEPLLKRFKEPNLDESGGRRRIAGCVLFSFG
jgi:hypothetical protein